MIPFSHRWVKGSWSECSAACGEGQMTRKVTCQQRMSATASRPLSDDFCTSQKPAVLRQCFGDTCYKWSVGEWNNVSQHSFGQEDEHKNSKGCLSNPIFGVHTRVVFMQSWSLFRIYQLFSRTFVYFESNTAYD